jgi:NTP pyrophosphatase (non-canonical NTP hydrolase)
LALTLEHRALYSPPFQVDEPVRDASGRQWARAAPRGQTVPDRNTLVATLREQMAQFVHERDWQQFHSPKNLSMALGVEAAELMEHFLWIDNAASREVVRDPGVLGQVADEIADVACLLFALVNALDLDLSDCVARKMAKNVVKYPVAKCRGRFRADE